MTDDYSQMHAVRVRAPGIQGLLTSVLETLKQSQTAIAGAGISISTIRTGSFIPQFIYTGPATLPAGLSSVYTVPPSSLQAALIAADGVGNNIPMILEASGFFFEKLGVEILIIDGTGNIIPFVNNAQTLGTASLTWKSLYLNVLFLPKLAASPGANASYGQVFTKTDGNFYYETPSGTVYQLTPPAVGTGAVKGGFRTVTNVNAQLLNTDYFVMANASTQAMTLTLPTASGNGGQTIVVKKIDSTTNHVNVQPQGSDYIDAAQAAIILATSMGSFTLISDNVNHWYQTAQK